MQPTEEPALLSLNATYIASVQAGDVARFNEILAPEFYCSNPDGTIVDRAGFLAQTAKPVTIKGLISEDVQIRMLTDDVAIIHGKTRYTTTDGAEKTGRYTDVWQRIGGNWLAVAAHVTRG